MVLEADNGTDVLLVCPHEGCGRRVVLNRRGGLTVLDQGDFFALHSASTPGLDLSAGIGG
jgi:hypothetical protein